MKYSKDMIDYVHDTLIDLIIAMAAKIPYEKPTVGDWCVEMTANEKENDYRVGILKTIDGDGEYTILNIGGHETCWHNACIKKIPAKMRRNIDLQFLQELHNKYENEEKEP